MKILFLVFQIFLIGCSATQKKEDAEAFVIDLNVVQERITLERPVEGIDRIRYQVLSVKSEKEGEQIVSARRDFLASQLIQSKDPYFGTPRFTPDCLSQNQVKDMEVRKSQPYFEAFVTVDRKWNPGICAGNFRPARVITRFCNLQLQVVEIIVTGEARKQADVDCVSPVKMFLRGSR